MARVGSITRKVKRRTGIGSFIFGTFFGFLLCIGTLVGLAFFAYYNVSINWVNNTFNAGIDTGNDELNKITLNDVVLVTVNLAENIEDYSISDLERDFGITVDLSMIPIDMEDLKDVEFYNLAQAIEDKISNLSAVELEDTGMISLAGVDFIFSKTNTYYYNSEDGMLYRNPAFTSAVCEVDYSAGRVVFDGFSAEVKSDNSVEVELGYLPLSIALSDFGQIAGDKVTIGELESEFGVELPKYLKNVDRNATINQLEDEIDKIYLGDFLGYDYNEATGKYFIDADDDDIFDEGEELNGVAKVVAYTTISGVGKKIDHLTVADVFDASMLSTGVLSLIDKDTVIEDIPDEIDEKFKTITLKELFTAMPEIAPSGYDDIKDQYVAGTSTKIEDLQLKELFNLSMNYIPRSPTPAG